MIALLGFECLQVNMNASPSKKMSVSNEVLYELLEENSNIYESKYSNNCETNFVMWLTECQLC